ncbi:hypothetical protein J437_LFUL009181 [Ladona fulva]|uniref:CBF1-interacting co-repressor CIR N-terminal domain-containing protein n=1 Tax=Ladona fulva TaxID=123851 RepID=A0A8K0JYA3_LADFU|nr:hypothetical protein J437_LFUL009181 [Ladona fulva]
MGGGDLNLKKSWHPSTMKNMEKVWKAEQKHEQEKRKIAELQREIREEREREEIRKFAEDGGVIEKKDECKLDWMYKGPGGLVSREDYLLGRSIDKSFDLLQEAEKEAAQTAEGSSRGLPGRSGLFDDQVDIARKLQEDPLLLIKRKELETRSQILNNPVKLKQLQRLLKEKKKDELNKKVKKKKKKKRKHRDSSSSSEEGDLDKMLAYKYNRLKDKLSNAEMAKLLSDDDEDTDKDKRKGAERRDESSTRERNIKDEAHSSRKGYGLQDPLGNQRKFSRDFSDAAKKDRSDRRDQEPMRRISEKERSDKIAPSKRGGESYRPPAPKKPLSEEELEQRRREMMDNARWREEQREKFVHKQREEEKREKNVMNTQTYDPSFLRKQLSAAASRGSVEGRIKSNINNIQRSGGAMDKNFARR